MGERTDVVRTALEAAARVTQQFAGDARVREVIAQCIELCTAALASDKKLLICGNGGSSADAVHFAEELTGRFRKDRPALAAIACADAGHITCTANDYGYEHVFSRWVEALGRPQDVLIVLSTSGNSANVAHAVRSARSRGLRTIALLGKTGGTLRGVCDLELIVPGETTDRIQELHMLALHIIVEGIEDALFPAV